MIKKLLFLISALLLSSSFAQADELKALKDSRVNIIFIFADDWGYGDLSAHGHEGLRTPNLDKMIQEGTEFQQFNVCSPVCSSSRTAVITGNFPSRHGIHAHIAMHEQNVARGMPDFLDPNVVLLPRLLQGAGYKTAHYGKWHLSNTFVADISPLPIVYGYNDTRVHNGGGPQVADGPEGHREAHWTDNSVSYAIDFIKANKDVAPFFVNLWIHDAHSPRLPTPEQREPYKDLEEPFQTYYSTVTNADKQIGRLFDFLKENGLDENTLIIFSSDNGPENISVKSGAAGETAGLRGRKRSLYEGGVKVPFIVRLPKYIQAGVMNKDSVIAAVDLLPTFCDIAGVKLPDNYKPDGEVITDVLQGKDFTRTKSILQYWQGSNGKDTWPRLSVKNNQWKLFSNFDKSKVELYDYKNDWAEENNLAEKYPDIVQAMLSEAFDYYKSLDIKHDNSKAVNLGAIKKKLDEKAAAQK